MKKGVVIAIVLIVVLLAAFSVFAAQSGDGGFSINNIKAWIETIWTF